MPVSVGTQGVYRHRSTSTGTDMEVAVYVPPQAADGPLPVLTYLSGLTCTWENFTVKAGAQRYAAEHGIIIGPDTSPRGLNLPGENDSYDFGTEPASMSMPRRNRGRTTTACTATCGTSCRRWSRRSSRSTRTVRASSATPWAADALVMAFRNPDRYRSVSAFSPIVSSSRVPWGEALGGYLGQDKEAWKQYDASVLAEKGGWKSPILVDQGTSDQFLEQQLKPEVFWKACEIRHSADGTAAARLRPQLLLHRHVHGRSYRASCQAAEGLVKAWFA